MKNFLIDRATFSDLFWNNIFSKGVFHIDTAKSLVIDRFHYFEKLRNLADYNTGSISLSTSVCISLLTSYFRPEVVAEVGTFIGRSTFSFAIAGVLNNSKIPKIYTCDFSNDIDLDFDPVFNHVIQFKRKSSTFMFESILNSNEIPDFYSIDGRIVDDDIPLLVSLGAKRSIFLLDDFEGVEKGVINSIKIINSFPNNFILIYPPSLSLLNNYGFKDACTMAVLMPKNSLHFVNQSG